MIRYPSAVSHMRPAAMGRTAKRATESVIRSVFRREGETVVWRARPRSAFSSRAAHEDFNLNTAGRPVRRWSQGVIFFTLGGVNFSATTDEIVDALNGGGIGVKGLARGQYPRGPERLADGGRPPKSEGAARASVQSEAERIAAATTRIMALRAPSQTPAIARGGSHSVPLDASLEQFLTIARPEGDGWVYRDDHPDDRLRGRRIVRDVVFKGPDEFGVGQVWLRANLDALSMDLDTSDP